MGHRGSEISCFILLSKRAKLQGYQSYRVSAWLSFPEALTCLLLIRNLRDGVQAGNYFCSVVQWVVARVGWDVLADGWLKSPCALGGHRAETGLVLEQGHGISCYSWCLRSSTRSRRLGIDCCAHAETGCRQETPRVREAMEKCTCTQKYSRAEVNLRDFSLLWKELSQFIIISVISSLLQKMHNMFGPKSKIRLLRMQKQS